MFGKLDMHTVFICGFSRFLVLYFQAIPLIDTTVEVDHVDSKQYGTGVGKGGYTEFGGGFGGMTTEDVHLYTQYQKLHGHGDYVGGGMGTGQSKYYSQRQFGAFDGMALSENFLGNYYLSVSRRFIKASMKSVKTPESVLSTFVKKNKVRLLLF